MFIFTWFAATLKQYPEIAIFLVLALGYYFGKFTFRGIGLGSVTATLLAGVLIGLLIGLAQALTQIQDQTVAFVPKIVAMVAVLILCLPWLIQKMVEYSESLIINIPKTIMGG